jgi:hypothetical protein
MLALAVLGNLVALLASYRNTLRHAKRPSSPDGDSEGTTGAT